MKDKTQWTENDDLPTKFLSYKNRSPSLLKYD